MKTATILSALLAVVAAVPLDKRRIYYTTTTTEVIEYVSITTTVYVDSLPTTSAQGGAFYNVPQGQPAVLTSSGPAPVSTSSAPPSAAPPAIPTTSAYVAPPAPAPPAPVAAPPSVYVAPPPAPSAPAPPPPPPPAPPAPVAAQAASNPSGPVYSGDITFYDVGMGSCGRYNTADQPVVALAVSMMNNPANPNNNPLCGKTITISYGGTTHQATVVDTCHDCSRESIDLSTSLFKLVAPGGDGRVHGVQWWFN